MFRVRSVARFVLAFFLLQTIAVSASVHAFTDWLDHERSHLVAQGAAANPDSAPANDAPAKDQNPGHHDACHGSHHVQASVGHRLTTPFVRITQRPDSTAAVPGAVPRPDLLYRPPRTAATA